VAYDLKDGVPSSRLGILLGSTRYSCLEYLQKMDKKEFENGIYNCCYCGYCCCYFTVLVIIVAAVVNIPV